MSVSYLGGTSENIIKSRFRHVIVQKGRNKAPGSLGRKTTMEDLESLSRSNRQLSKRNATSNPRPPKTNLSSETSVILPISFQRRVLPHLPDTEISREFCWRWVASGKNSSLDERMFVLAAHSMGLRRACIAAVGLGWKCSRPVKEFRRIISRMTKPAPKVDRKQFEGIIGNLLKQSPAKTESPARKPDPGKSAAQSGRSVPQPE